MVHLQLALRVDCDVVLKRKVHRLRTLVNPLRNIKASILIKIICALHLFRYPCGWKIYLLFIVVGLCGNPAEPAAKPLTNRFVLQCSFRHLLTKAKN